MERVLIFGASRGLGAELVKQLCSDGKNVIGFGRKADRLQALSDAHPSFSYHVTDLSTADGQARALELLNQDIYDRVLFVLGGGPFGLFHTKSWRDHQWALEVSFLFQARALHVLANRPSRPPTVVVGSAVAEDKADPKAASYCAAKHALRGLVLSLRAEYPDWDLRLFSPGYIDTDMLPKNAAARQQPPLNPAALARELWAWTLTADPSGHKVYPH